MKNAAIFGTSLLQIKVEIQASHVVQQTIMNMLETNEKKFWQRNQKYKSWKF